MEVKYCLDVDIFSTGFGKIGRRGGISWGSHYEFQGTGKAGFIADANSKELLSTGLTRLIKEEGSSRV